MTDLTANGHNRSQEKNVARRLYISIVAAVILGMILFVWMGQKPALDPNTTRPAVQSESTQTQNPETNPNAAPASR